ncbi:MAG TPA: Rpn family recombination-promoting nuclease/putative transposase [Campylobacterales bacterium]|nr:Rpn family recombination-promoting nuclease/putative transposase [Campylobacterales bacterium]
MRFLDVKTDYAFKKVFGSNESKDILISFLNSICEFNIVDLEIVDPYNIPMLKGMKDTYVDVKAKLDNKKTIIIEMQVLNHEGFEKRVLYNAAKNYSTQLDKNERYNLLNPVIAITITDFNMFETSKHITYFKLLEKEEFIEYSGDIELIFIELPKFKKDIQECRSIQDRWIYFIKNAGSLEYLPKSLDKEIQKALQIVNEANLTRDELELQYKRKEFIIIQKTAVSKAKEEGIKEGIEKGIKEGIKEGIEKGIKEGEIKKSIEIAKNLLKNKIDDEIIQISTGLSKDEIEKIKANCNNGKN